MYPLEDDDYLQMEAGFTFPQSYSGLDDTRLCGNQAGDAPMHEKGAAIDCTPINIRVENDRYCAIGSCLVSEQSGPFWTKS